MLFFSFLSILANAAANNNNNNDVHYTAETYIVNWVREIKNPSDSKSKWRRRQQKNLLISAQKWRDGEAVCSWAICESGFDSYFGTQKDVVVKQKRCKQLNVIECEKRGKELRHLNTLTLTALKSISIGFNTFHQIEHRQQCSKEFGFIFASAMDFTFSSTKSVLEQQHF